ncbi:BZ3500_MvSof-1268-A1-R1_Chr5-2g07731 [Microbotryum saponariae]|uniref:BZ3500_MvSof-1268-A1-R1_Chr5-2g07731 protein n=1 Tax=Microbotryum saponariae TaxID=289078 RepID=A0A2X0L0R1_9BASI|nr:BZ3500_MvSof-1268-A1-R1_Chr5-2g07731 [Microbotryum saponariae]SDA05600.1 BZ3501_MvSof-1269-A2-R1_Chr5-2g07553 [Microbotryum saponariae]
MLQDVVNHLRPRVRPPVPFAGGRVLVEANGMDGDLNPKPRWSDDEPDQPHINIKQSLPHSRFAAYDAPTSPDAGSNKFASSAPPSSPGHEHADRVDSHVTSALLSVAVGAIARAASANSETRSMLQSPAPVIAHPIQLIENDDTRLVLERGVVMQLGRKAKRPTQPRLETTLPVQLAKSAKHASRMHCTLRILPRTRQTPPHKVVVQVHVLGMNGMKIDGRLFRKSSVAVLTVPIGHKLKLSLWSWQGVVHIADSELPKQRNATDIPYAAPLSPVALSVYDSLTDGDASNLRHRDGSFELATPNEKSRGPASPAHSDHSLLSALPSSPSAQEDDEVEMDNVDQISAESTRAAALVESLGLDLPGLIASAIVFSPRSTVDVETVVQSLLREVGGMWDVLEDGKGSEDLSQDREDQAVEAWWEVVERVLCQEPFFGCIDNAGLKDASGHSLQPLFFYMPDSDPSRSRVAALEPFVKRVRGARQRPAQYFWRKPSLRKNR